MTTAPVSRSALVFQHLDESALVRLAQDVAALTKAGDLIALSGDLGVGKSVFARGMIRYHGDPTLSVPSPTFSLRIDYELPGMRICHVDLYRIEGPEAIEELGIADALRDGAVVVEWPQSLSLEVDDRLEVLLEGDTERRSVQLVAQGSWSERLVHLAAIRAVVEQAGFAEADRRPVAGDVSGRAYRRLSSRTGTAILMDAPPRLDGPEIHRGKSFETITHRARTIGQFCAVAAALRSGGVNAPAVLAANLGEGLAVLQDFGSQTIADKGQPVPARYETAVDALIAMHRHSWPDAVPLPGGGIHGIPPYDRDALLAEVSLFPDWYTGVEEGPALAGADRVGFLAAWDTALAPFCDTRECWVLLDFHSPNLMWLPDESGTNRIGVLDFQDVLRGHCAYDLASLAQDVRVAMPAELEHRLKARYLEGMPARTERDAASFDKAYSVFAAQRATKVLGAFSRLINDQGKTGYRPALENARTVLRRTLNAPVLSSLRDWYRPYLPADGGAAGRR